MALDYSQKFYNSKAWRECAKMVRETHHYICQECNNYGNQVHHIKEITPDNITDPNITLNKDNLQLLCEECHNSKRRTHKDIEDGLKFDTNGNLINKKN